MSSRSARTTHLLLALALACSGVAMAPPASADPGWSPVADLSLSADFLAPADVAVGPKGQVAVVWDRDGDIEVVRRTAAGVWGPAHTLAGSGHARSPQVEYDGTGRLHAAWAVVDHPNAGNGPSRIKVSHTRRSGGWTPAETVAERALGQFRGLDLEVNRSGAAVLAWEWLWHDFARRVLLTERTAGGAWRVARRWNGAEDFDVAIGNKGMAVLAMTRYAHDAVSTAVVRRPRPGAWGPLVELATWPTSGPGTLAGAQATVDAAGTAVVVWQGRAPSKPYRPYASRARAGLAWSDPVALTSDAGDSGAPLVASTPSGDVLTAWSRVDGRIQAVRRPDGGAWSSPVSIAPAGQSVAGLDLALDPGGRAVAAWVRAPYEWEDGTEVTAARMGGAGSWQPGEAVSSPGVMVNTPLVSVAHGGDAAVTWAGLVSGLEYRVQARTYDAP